MRCVRNPEILMSSSMQPMRDVIFLVHRIPFPPEKGDKIRSFHLLKGLSRCYRVHLGTFVDCPDDRQYQNQVAQWCASSCFVNLDPRLACWRSAAGLLTGEPLTFVYYRSGRLRRWVKQVMARYDIQALIAFSGCMAQYGIAYPNVRRILDLVDIDSEKWRQYSERTHRPFRWLYRREYQSLRRSEIRLARVFDETVLVSRQEADLLRSTMGRESQRPLEISNGVDTRYFDPSLTFPDPYRSEPSAKPSIAVFTGAMDYRPNVDAILWFTANVWPRIRAHCPTAQLWIVGSRPAASVRELSGQAGIFVTGYVTDVRPYLRYAKVAVAPLQIARGLQNKVLEALAMELPVVATPQAWEGIDLDVMQSRLGDSTGNAEVMAHKVSVYLAGQCRSNAEGRRFVSERYNWATVLRRFCQIVDGQSTDLATVPVSGGLHE